MHGASEDFGEWWTWLPGVGPEESCCHCDCWFQLQVLEPAKHRQPQEGQHIEQRLRVIVEDIRGIAGFFGPARDRLLHRCVGGVTASLEA